MFGGFPFERRGGEIKKEKVPMKVNFQLEGTIIKWGFKFDDGSKEEATETAPFAPSVDSEVNEARMSEFERDVIKKYKSDHGIK